MCTSKNCTTESGRNQGTGVYQLNDQSWGWTLSLETYLCLLVFSCVFHTCMRIAFVICPAPLFSLQKKKKSVTSPFSFPDYHFYGSTGNSFWLCLSPEKIANLHGEIWQAVQFSMIRRLDVLGILILCIKKLNDPWMIVRAFWYLKKNVTENSKS